MSPASKYMAVLCAAAAACAFAAEGPAPATPAPSRPLIKTPVMFDKETSEHPVPAAVTTSDGASASGLLYTRLDMPLPVFDRARRRFVALELADVSRIDVSVEAEKDEPYWHWKQSGSDEKVFTGKTYPSRAYLTKVTLSDGKTVTGDLSAPLFLKDAEGKEIRYVLYRKHKGEEGQKLSDLVYVKSIVVSGAKGDAASGRTPEAAPSSTDSTLKTRQRRGL